MRKSGKILFAIIYITIAALCAGCGMVDTERDGVNDPKSGSYIHDPIPGLVVMADGEVIENGGAYFVPMTELGTTREVTFTIENNGEADLILTGSTPVEVSGEGLSVFSIKNQPYSTLSTGCSLEFIIEYSTYDLSIHTIIVSIETNIGTFNCYICDSENWGKINSSDAYSGDWFGCSVSIYEDRIVVGSQRNSNNRGAAYVYSWDGSNWVEYKLTASDGADDDLYGWSVDIYNDWVIVGAIFDDDKGDNSGSAYVYHWNGITWVEEQKLTASDGAEFDFFGSSVSISGDRAIVGVDDGYTGAAYVYYWNGSSWVEEQKLTASDGAEGDNFGCSVSISGDRAIVGSYGDDDNGSLSGSAYVYHWDGSKWVEEQKLTASDGAEFDSFGGSVSISGDRVIVGADNNDDMGAAYVYHLVGSTWAEEQKLTASDGASYDNFGSSVSISGDWAIVGAWSDDDHGSMSGSAYVYHFVGSTWAEEKKLTAPDGEAGDVFGYSVSIYGERAIVGAYKDYDKASSGSIYMFKSSKINRWYRQKFTPKVDASGDNYGCSVAISGDWAIVGSKYDDQGSAYMYYNNWGAWEYKQKLNASDGKGGDCFGCSVSIDGDRAIVGATSGKSAYVYQLVGSTWVEEQKLTASDGESGDSFGCSVSISGDWAIVGAYRDDIGFYNDVGSAYIFHWDGSKWVEEQKLNVLDGYTSDGFGVSVSISGDRAIVGTERDDSSYIYQWNGSTWIEEQKLTASDYLWSNDFGCSVSIDGDRAIVGAKSGESAYVYHLFGSTWVEEQKLTDSGFSWGWYGCSVSISGDRAIVGTWSRESAYVYHLVGSTWVENKLTDPDGGSGDSFGRSVSISDDWVTVGAPNDDDMGTNSGSAYFYKLLSQ